MGGSGDAACGMAGASCQDCTLAGLSCSGGTCGGASANHPDLAQAKRRVGASGLPQSYEAPHPDGCASSLRLMLGVGLWA